MTIKPFAVQGTIKLDDNFEITPPTGYEAALSYYQSQVATLTSFIQAWDDTVNTASGGVWTVPPRFKRPDHTLYDRIQKATNENAWEWTRGVNQDFLYYDLQYVTAPPLNVVNQASVVKNAYAALSGLAEKFKTIGEQGPSTDASRAIQIRVGSPAALWVFDLDNTWDQADFTTVPKGRLTLPNGATITSSQLPELLAARQVILDYNVGWHFLCDDRGAARDRANRAGGSYTQYFWQNTDVLDSQSQRDLKAQLTTMWQEQQSGTFTHYPISADFYQQMRAYLTLDKFSAYEALLASTTVNVGNYSFTFRSNDGALVLPEGGAIKSTTDSSLASAETLYNNALATWASTKAGLIIQAADASITQQGWPFIAWNVTGLNAQTYLDYVLDAWSIQATPPSSPPAPNPTLLFVPAISTNIYNVLVSSITGVRNTYTTWQNLQKGVDIVANTTKLSVLSDDKLQVPGIIQTDAEENITVRTRYSATSSSGIVTENSLDWTFGTNGNLSLPYGSSIFADGANLKVTSGHYLYIDSADMGQIEIGRSTGGTIILGRNGQNVIVDSDLMLKNTSTIKDTSQYAVSFGRYAGLSSQGSCAVAIGFGAGQYNQVSSAIAIGQNAGNTNQATSSVAIAPFAGYTGQGANSVAIGPQAGYDTQGNFSIAIGSGAGQTAQGAQAIAIGQLAGGTSQHANSIILNAAGTALNSDGTSRLYINPIRNDSTQNNLLFYNTTSKEVTYSTLKGGGSWTVTTGTNTYSFEVTAGATYVMWVRGTTNNGVIAWNATVTLTNTNLPALGQQRAYAYSGAGTLLDFTSLPSRIVGAEGTTTRSPTILGTSSGLIEFGISNTSPGDVTVYYGWTKI